MRSQYILTSTAMSSHVASSQHYEVPGDSWGMAIIVLLAYWVCWFKFRSGMALTSKACLMWGTVCATCRRRRPPVARRTWS